jgi:hypothetical protein
MSPRAGLNRPARHLECEFVLPHNYRAFLMVIVAFGVAGGLGWAVGYDAPVVRLFVPAGLLVTGLDVGYRFQFGGQRWFDPHQGGHLCLIPMWIVGLLYSIIGALCRE